MTKFDGISGVIALLGSVVLLVLNLAGILLFPWFWAGTPILLWLALMLIKNGGDDFWLWMVFLELFDN